MVDGNKMKNDTDKNHVEEKNEEPELKEKKDVVEEFVVTKKEFDALQSLASQREDQYKRALADYQNLQKRSREDRQELIRTANRDLLLRILTVLDTLILAYQHIQDTNIQVSIQHFLDVLKAEGVTKIEPVGKKFDPNLMEAIATGEGKEGIVTDELRAGFLIHDTLLRAAQVKVGDGSNNTGKESNPIMNESGTIETWNKDDLEKGEDMLKEDK